MNGSDSLRGYLVQTLISILQAFQDEDDWEAFTLEPLNESEKIDIKWRYPQYFKVVQVKSSKNPFQKPKVISLCKELKTSTQADLYELQLVGPRTGPVISLAEYDGVNIYSHELNIDGMIERIAHQLDKYCERNEIPSTSPSARERLAKYLTGELIVYSTKREDVTRALFDNWLKQSILLWPYESTDEDPIIELTSAKSVISTHFFQSETWMHPLPVKRFKDNSQLPEKFELHNLLKEKSRLILIGKSGSGKTSTMWNAAKLLNQDTQNIYFWIPLKSYSHSLESTIKRLLGWHSVADNKVIPMLQKHKIGLLLDGLNEVAEGQKEQCISEIETLINSYKACLCISFPSTDHSYYNFSCETYELLPLEKEQVDQAIKEYYKERDTLNKLEFFLDTIRRSNVEKKTFYKLFQTPLHLQFLFELAESDDFGHRTIKDLYGQIIEKRLAKSGERKQRGKIAVNTKIKCLMILAFRSIIEDRKLQLSSTFVRKILSDTLSSTELEVAEKEIIRSGLLIEISNHFVEWPHPSFRDYLAGRYLFELVELDESLDGFPFGEIRGVAAVAHAVRLSTTEPVTPSNRPKIFLTLLQKRPIFEAVQAAAVEYDILKENGNRYHLKCTISDFKQMQWGERFLKAYDLIVEMARREKFPNVTRIPYPQGLTVFFNQEVDFCLVMFSDYKGIGYGESRNVEPLIEQAIKSRVTVGGFCLYAPFLCLLDPEILAYIEVGIWLRLTSSNNSDERLAKWHDSLSSLIKTPNNFANWTKLNHLPKPQVDLCPGPEQTFRILYEFYPPDMIESMKATTDIIPWAKQELLSWEEFYAPITFKVDPEKTQEAPKPISNRLSQVMVMSPPSHQISLILLLPWTPKVDRGIDIFVSNPVQIFNRYYFLYSSFSTQTSSGKLVTFAHLRG